MGGNRDSAFGGCSRISHALEPWAKAVTSYEPGINPPAGLGESLGESWYLSTPDPQTIIQAHIRSWPKA